MHGILIVTIYICALFHFSHMKQLLQFSVLALCCLVLYGCPYESHVPIDAPNVPVANNLLGKWKTPDESYSEYYISRANATQYRIQQRVTTGETKQYLAHITQIKSALFLNLYSDSTKTYYLYRIKMNVEGSRLTLMPLSENLSEHFGSSIGLKSYVEKNMNMQSMYNDNDKEDFEKVQ